MFIKCCHSLALVCLIVAAIPALDDNAPRRIGIERDCILVVDGIEPEKVVLIEFSQRMSVERSRDIDFGNEVAVSAIHRGQAAVAAALEARLGKTTDRLLISTFFGGNMSTENRKVFQIALIQTIAQRTDQKAGGLVLVPRDNSGAILKE